MSIYAKNKSMSNCKVGDNQVSKILLNDQIIWENWTGPYSESKSDPASSYRNVASVSWSFSKGVKLVYAHSTAGNKNSEQNRAKIYISTSDGKYNTTCISDSGTSDFEIGTGWSGEIENVTYVKCTSEGTVNVKWCNGEVKYYKKGS